MEKGAKKRPFEKLLKNGGVCVLFGLSYRRCLLHIRYCLLMRFVVSNAHAHSSSHLAAEIEIKPFSFAQNIIERDTVDARCFVTGSRDVTFKWLKDGHEFGEKKPKVAITTMGPISTLYINEVTT